MMIFRRKDRGLITVFVTLILVPVIVCTGTMVDFARMRLYSSQAAMTADIYGETLLSEYDHTLKELYGLFALTQNEDAKTAIVEIAEQYAKYSFNPNGEGEEIGGWMPYKDANVTMTYLAIEGSSLANNNVLSTQINDFMKFRVVEMVIGELDFLDVLTQMDSYAADMNAVSERSKVSETSSNTMEKVGEYFEVLATINDYPDYKDGREAALQTYALQMNMLIDSDDYADYLAYLALSDAERNQIEDAHDAKVEAEANGETVEPEVSALADKYFDVDGYKEEIKTELDALDKSMEDSRYAIKFGEVSAKLDDLSRICNELDGLFDEIEKEVEAVHREAENCNVESLKQEMLDEISDLEDVLEKKDLFRGVLNLLKENQNGTKDANNKTEWEDTLKTLNTAKDNIIDGDDPGCELSAVSDSISFEWYDYSTESQEYKEFHDYVENSAGSADQEGGEDIADKVTDKVDELMGKHDITEDEDKDYDKIPDSDRPRDITSGLASQLEISSDGGDVPDLLECLTGGNALASLGKSLVSKFMLTSYDFGMFSSRVTGIEPPDDSTSATGGDTDVNAGDSSVTSSVPTVDPSTVDPSAGSASGEGDSEENDDYVEESLTGYELCKENNYLYGAELEYLIGGHNSSKENLNHTRNIILGIRTSMNFISTYTIKEINDPIKAIAEAAKAAASAVPYVGVILGPLAYVAVSGALRLLVATLESYADWELLKQREAVIFFKTDIQDLSMDDALLGSVLNQCNSSMGSSSADEVEINNSSGSSGNKTEFKLSYEDYMFIIMVFMSQNTLLDRTTNLVTLNVNQYNYVNGDDYDPSKDLTTLDFQMQDTRTAVNCTCEVEMGFMVLPEGLVNKFLDSSEASDMRQQVEDSTYGYSVIRGY